MAIRASVLWAGGQTLTPDLMNTHISGMLDDLAGRNGVIELEDSAVVLDGADGNRYFQLPGGTTAQRPTTGLRGGLIRWNSTTATVEYYNGTTWVSPDA